MKKCGFILAAVVAATAAIVAQTPQAPPAAQQPAPPVTIETALQNQHRTIRGFLVNSSEMMPEADYAFKPTPAQRMFGELIAHVAQANFSSCAAMLSEPNPMAPAGGTRRNLEAEAPKLTKADLVKLLSDSLTLCDRAYATVTAANVAEMITTGQNQASRGGRMSANTAHNNESYGTMVVYLRLKGFTPPSSEGR
jgi:hypothetical protein